MSFEMKSPILMVPGPIDVPEEVMKRCGHQVFPHYDAQTLFPAFYHQLVEKMKYIFGLKDGMVFVPNGSGTIAVNMALASLCTTDDDVLVVENGTFGAYAEKNLKAIGVPYTLVKTEWGKVYDPDAVRNEMKRKKHKFIYMTFNESSTTILNPITPLGKIAREFDALLIADAVSGVGGAVIDMGGNGADVVAGASQKCLELPPGLAPVAVGERAWKYMDSMKNRRVPFILDFVAWRKAYFDQYENHPQPVTGATTLLYALDWVIDEIIKEGIENREARFRSAGDHLKKGMAEFGFRTSADQEYASPVTTNFLTPNNIEGDIIRNYYLEKHNTMVGYGYTNFDPVTKKSISFRIAHFGTAASPERVEHILNITRQYFIDNK